MENKQTKIFGLRTVIEAIRSGKTIRKVYLQKNLGGPLFGELSGLLKELVISKSFVPIEKLNRLSKNQNHQGVVAEISPIDFADLDQLISTCLDQEDKPLFLVLDAITDVRNFGAIIRTAESTGVKGIVIQNQGNAPVNAETIKTSAGAAFNIPICKVSHIKDALFQFQAAEIQLVAATEKATDRLYDIDLKGPTAIIIGSEDRGINPSVLKMVDHKACLPMQGSIGSLNVSVACGAFLYEAIRQRLGA
ncbi:MAG: 23S rRNA (guanosine(2251)-2'-O)-methyltransferase RlmB [Lutibacter sp.]|jgi:23S rRNA (guanosine2251-2'-O)-methyltransferase|nr:23S rRNA (guanosine(2251)-2'-O)-methyltransferase RlmB [Lutibacter sp.]